MIRDKRQYLREQCRKYPDNPTHHRKLAEALVDDGLHGEALEVYRHCLQLTPEDPRIWHQLGVCCRSIGMTTEAVNAFRQAIQRAPNYASAYRNLGLCLLDMEMPVEAAGFFEATLKLSPRMEGVRIPLARCFELLNRVEDALTQYQLEHEMNPKNWKLRWRQAQLFVQLNHSVEAYHILQEIFAQTRNQPEADDIRDLLRQVRQQVRESGTMVPGDKEELDSGDEAATESASPPEAPVETETPVPAGGDRDPMRRLQRAVMQEPDKADLRIALAEAHAGKGEWQAAVEAYRRAVALLRGGTGCPQQGGN